MIILDTETKILTIVECFAILHVDFSIVCRFNSHFNAEWGVQHLSNNVAIIPEEETATTMFDIARAAAKINYIKNIFPISPGTTKKIKTGYKSFLIHFKIRDF